MPYKFALLVVVLLLAGCLPAKVGRHIGYDIKAEYYLQERDYTSGAESFQQALAENPNDPKALYYYGRFLLANGKAGEAKGYLERAVKRDPKMADAHFWLGVAYGQTGNPKQESQSYQRCLDLDPDHPNALIHQGHSLLKRKKYEESLALYERALKIWPQAPQPLYNRGIILRQLQRTPEERLALLLYLDAYPAGSFARQAADRLNQLGDYSYQNHQLGIRIVTLTEISFYPFTLELKDYARSSLATAAEIAANTRNVSLNVVVYQKNNTPLAKAKAKAIAEAIHEEQPQLRAPGRVRISWFGVAEERTVGGRKVRQDETVRLWLSK